MNRRAGIAQSKTKILSLGGSFSGRGFILLVAILAMPHCARAHGELLVRIAALTRQLATNGSPQLYLQRGELYREDQNWEAAEADYARVAQLEPALAEVDFCRAKLLVDRAQFDAARAMFDTAIARSPTNGLAHICRARLLVRMGQRKAALPDFERGISLLVAPEPECYLDWAQALAAEGLPREALQKLDLGIQRFGPINTLQVYAVGLELAQNNTNAAIARLDTIIDHAPRKELWLTQRGDIQASAGRLVEARQSYEAAIEALKLLPPPLLRSPPNQRLLSRITSSLGVVTPLPPAPGGTN